MLALLYCN